MEKQRLSDKPLVQDSCFMELTKYVSLYFECKTYAAMVLVKKKFLHLMEQGACVGLYFINRPEWLVVDHACAAYSFVSVPLYDTLGNQSKFDFFSLVFEFCKPCLFLI